MGVWVPTVSQSQVKAVSVQSIVCVVQPAPVDEAALLIS